MKNRSTVLFAILVVALLIVFALVALSVLNDPHITDPLFCGECTRIPPSPTNRPTLPGPTDTPNDNRTAETPTPEKMP